MNRSGPFCAGRIFRSKTQIGAFVKEQLQKNYVKKCEIFAIIFLDKNQKIWYNIIRKGEKGKNLYPRIRSPIDRSLPQKFYNVKGAAQKKLKK